MREDRALFIAQISDIHIGAPDERPFDVDVRQNFLKTLADAAAHRPDHLVLSGDLCFREADPSVYSWVRAQVEATALPYSVIPGNHDETEMLADAFGMRGGLHGKEFYEERMIGGYRLLFLDSSRSTVSAAQLEWLSERVNDHSADDGPLTVFMHHPPVRAGVPYMDRNFPLKNRDAVRSVLIESGLHAAVFCGHYHVDMSILSSGLSVYLTPSTFFQIDQWEDDFKVEHHNPGWRAVRLEGEKVETTVRYLERIPKLPSSTAAAQ